MRTKNFAACLAFTIAALLYPTDAAAYIDPNAGSLAYQALLAMALGLGFVFRSARARVSQALHYVRQKLSGGQPQQ